MNTEVQETPEPKIHERDCMVKGHRYVRYDVDFGQVNTKRTRQSFKTLAQAERAIRNWGKKKDVDSERQKSLSKRIGQFATKLTNDDLMDAAQGLAILKRAVRLSDAAAFYMRHNHSAHGKKTVAEAMPEFIMSRKERGCRALTVRAYSDRLTFFCRDHGTKPIAHITVAVLEEWLRSKKFTMVTRRSVMRHLGAFFQWAVKRRFMAENPVMIMEVPRLDKKPITYLTPKEVEQLLRATVKKDPELIPYVAIGLFAGLRPVEMHGEKTDHGPLDWKHIDLKRGKITVTPEQDKNRRGRLVDVSPALLAWLFPCQKAAGPVIYTRARFEAVVQKSAINYRKDIMRHTFGTFHYAMHHHEGDTAVQLGDTIATVKGHYVNPLVDKEDAEQFWSIRPEAETESNVLQFVNAG